MAPPIITHIKSPQELETTYDILIPDTNVLLSYPAIIPSSTHPSLPTAFFPSLNHTHIVIPSIINDELDHLKGQHISISVSARNAIRRLEELSQGHEDYFTLQDSFNLRNNLRIQYTDENTHKHIDVLFSFWSVNSEISVPPFFPTDSDGKIIASALSLPKTGWYADFNTSNNPKREKPKITLLSNDRDVRFRAHNFGLSAVPYGPPGPSAYAGRRTIVNTPRVIYTAFLRDRCISGKTWRHCMPNEAPLMPNEFIVFLPPNPKKSSSRKRPRSQKRKRGRPIKPPTSPSTLEAINLSTKLPSEHFNFIGRYDATLDQIVPLEYLDRSPVEPENIGQAIHVESMMNPLIGVIIVDNAPHYHSNHVAIISYRTNEPAFPDDIYDKFNFN